MVDFRGKMCYGNRHSPQLRQIGPMTIQVPLSEGLFALVDDADAALISGWSWDKAKAKNLIYAVTYENNRAVAMHRKILNAPEGVFVDHVNGDGLDNRRSNLRLCSHTENMRNRRKLMDAASRFKGVTKASKGKNWRATIYPSGVQIHLGTFATEEAAARSYDRAARIFFGEFAKTNKMMGLLT